MKKNLVLLLSVVMVTCSLLCACAQTNFEEAIGIGTCLYSDKGFLSVEIENASREDITYLEGEILDLASGSETISFKRDCTISARDSVDFEFETSTDWSGWFITVKITNVNHEDVNLTFKSRVLPY